MASCDPYGSVQGCSIGQVEYSPSECQRILAGMITSVKGVGYNLDKCVPQRSLMCFDSHGEGSHSCRRTK